MGLIQACAQILRIFTAECLAMFFRKNLTISLHISWLLMPTKPPWFKLPRGVFVPRNLPTQLRSGQSIDILAWKISTGKHTSLQIHSDYFYIYISERSLTFHWINIITSSVATKHHHPMGVQRSTTCALRNQLRIQVRHGEASLWPLRQVYSGDWSAKSDHYFGRFEWQLVTTKIVIRRRFF